MKYWINLWNELRMLGPKWTAPFDVITPLCHILQIITFGNILMNHDPHFSLLILLFNSCFYYCCTYLNNKDTLDAGWCGFIKKRDAIIISGEPS